MTFLKRSVFLSDYLGAFSSFTVDKRFSTWHVGRTFLL